jgi:hypothetical protein
MLNNGEAESVQDLADKLGHERSQMSRYIRLTKLAPDIIEAIVNNREPDTVNLTTLRQSIPDLWDKQRKMFGMA